MNPVVDSLKLKFAAQLGLAKSPAVAAGSDGSAFTQALQQALKSVSQTQNDSAKAQNALQMDRDGASIEQTMISMQRSNLAFTAAVTVRNKMVSAYSEIMNMQV